MSLEHILLGMLEQPASGYELKRQFDEGARYFWSAELSQIYPTLQRMKRLGWLTSFQQTSSKGPPRSLYRRTSKGSKELKRWLAHPVWGTERTAYIAQLIFLGQLDNPVVTLRYLEELSERFRLSHQVLSDAMRGSELLWPDGPQSMPTRDLHEWLALGFGVSVLQARLDQCQRALQVITERVEADVNGSSGEKRPPGNRKRKGVKNG